MHLIQNNYVAWAVSGLLLGIGFVVPSMWILGVGGGVYFLYTLLQKSSLLHKYFGATLAWTIKSACANSFFWSVYPIEWLPVEFGGVQLLLIGMYWITTSLWLGLGAVVVVTGYHIAKKYQHTIYEHLPLIIFPITWVLGEIAGSFIFSVMMIGPGGTFNAAYSFGYSGYLLAEHDILLQFARLGGAYALGVLFACIVIILLLVVWNKKTTPRIVASLVIGVVYFSGFHQYFFLPVITEDGYKVASIDTYPVRSEVLDRTDFEKSVAITEAVEAALALNGDYIILPEDAQFFNQNQPIGSAVSNINMKYNNPSQIILDSAGVVVDNKNVVQAFVFNGQEEEIERIQKGYLVPQGEFMPTLYNLFLGLLGQSNLTEIISSHVSFEVGSLTDQSQMASNTPGILFCFESVDPQGIRRLVADRPDMPFVAHPLSHTWFYNSKTLWHQLDTMLRIQAVWNQQYIISASNQAYSSVFSPMGVVDSLPATIVGDQWVVREVVIPR
jgi:apolipoprotein N-acyltransferase